ncbi:MAG: OsmC family protein [Anaerolineaceae bacterium]|nr:OsmC family protein [Anaerolineaceae bacterium]
MHAKAVWNGDMGFTGANQDGFLVPMDAQKQVGGHDMGFRPLELLAIGLAGCTGMDVISILKKKRQEITQFEVNAEVERAAEHPKVFTKIVLEYKFSGKNLDPQAVERAVELSETKYCGAQAMLRETAEITHKISITQED